MQLGIAILFDNMTVASDQLEARFRPYGTRLHGQTTTQSVFWNTNGEEYMDGKEVIVHSQQFGWGYVIGTRGDAAEVETLGGDNTEQIGRASCREREQKYGRAVQCKKRDVTKRYN